MSKNKLTEGAKNIELSIHLEFTQMPNDEDLVKLFEGMRKEIERYQKLQQKTVTREAIKDLIDRLESNVLVWKSGQVDLEENQVLDWCEENNIMVEVDK